MVVVVRQHFARVFYGAVAMTVSILVFNYFNEHEDQSESHAIALQLSSGADQPPQQQLVTAASQTLTSQQFLAALDKSTALTPQEKEEIRKFWRNLCNKTRRNSHSSSEPLVLADPSGTSSAAASTSTRPRPLSTCVTVADQSQSVAVTLASIESFAKEYRQVFPLAFSDAQLAQVVQLALGAAAVSRASKWNQNARYFVQSTGSILLSTGKKFHAIAMDTKGEMQQAIQATVRVYVVKALDLVALRLKNMLKDRHMPMYLQTGIDLTVDRFLPDVKVEVLRKTMEYFSNERNKPLHRGSGLSERMYLEHSRSRMTWYCSVRAFVLYHLFPYDKTMWRSFKDPWFIVLTLVGILPYVGQIWWLLLFVLKDKTNEHLLCEFIIGFKAAQFVTLGLIHTALGVGNYISCVLRGSLMLCQEDGPVLNAWNAFFFVLQIALVWAAFMRLPYTIRSSSRRSLPSHHSGSPRENSVKSPMSSRSARRRSSTDIFGYEIALHRGGYLTKLFGYETMAFCVILLLAAVVLMVDFEVWQRKMLLYWIRTSYGLLSFPYLAFKIPVIRDVLMHTRRMGYNQFGEAERIGDPLPGASAAGRSNGSRSNGSQKEKTQ